jgi:hypothetical protein
MLRSSSARSNGKRPVNQNTTGAMTIHGSQLVAEK